MDLTYILTPLVAWFIAGKSKFIINCFKEKRLAFDLIGYGGLPSTHTSIVTSMPALIALKEGIDNSIFGVAITLAFIVILDANSLRLQVGKQAHEINKLASKENNNHKTLRERIGHSKIEIFAGLIAGILAAVITHTIL